MSVVRGEHLVGIATSDRPGGRRAHRELDDLVGLPMSWTRCGPRLNGLKPVKAAILWGTVWGNKLSAVFWQRRLALNSSSVVLRPTSTLHDEREETCATGDPGYSGFRFGNGPEAINGDMTHIQPLSHLALRMTARGSRCADDPNDALRNAANSD